MCEKGYFTHRISYTAATFRQTQKKEGLSAPPFAMQRYEKLVPFANTLSIILTNDSQFYIKIRSFDAKFVALNDFLSPMHCFLKSLQRCRNNFAAEI